MQIDNKYNNIINIISMQVDSKPKTMVNNSQSIKWRCILRLKHFAKPTGFYSHCVETYALFSGWNFKAWDLFSHNYLPKMTRRGKCREFFTSVKGMMILSLLCPIYDGTQSNWWLTEHCEPHNRVRGSTSRKFSTFND